MAHYLICVIYPHKFAEILSDHQKTNNMEYLGESVCSKTSKHFMKILIWFDLNVNVNINVNI